MLSRGALTIRIRFWGHVGTYVVIGFYTVSSELGVRDLFGPSWGSCLLFVVGFPNDSSSPERGSVSF